MVAGCAVLASSGKAGVIEVDKFIATDAGLDDNFAITVAIDGDTALAGAEYDDGPAGTNQGSAYVFIRNGSNWVQQAKLTADDAVAGDLFGVSVAVDGDTAIVGAFGNDGDAGENQGAAYVFVRTGTTWTQQAKLIADDAATFDNFGFQVAVRGDTALIGAESGGGAYVFVRSGTSWTQQDKLVPSDIVFQLFAVALGEGTAIIGYPNAPGPAHASQGAAYVFVRSGTNWTQQDKLVANDATTADGGFGISLGLFGQTAVAGAWAYDGIGGVDQGAAYVFVRNGSTWTQQAKLTADDGAAQDQLGNSVAIEGNLVLAGSSGPTSQYRGAVYRYVRDGTSWTQTDKLLAGDPAPFDAFGYALGIEGGLAVIGAYGDEEGANQGGAGYIFDVGISCASDFECADLGACTCDRCISNVCRQTDITYGDVNCAGPVNQVNLDDILCVLMGFSNFDSCPNGDIAPACTGNSAISLDDILAVLAAFGGADPCGCLS